MLGALFVPTQQMDAAMIRPLFSPMIGGHGSPYGREPLNYEVVTLQKRIDTLMGQIKARDSRINELGG